MSERKTAEFKLRCTPEEKIRWQSEADRRKMSVSELVRETVNEALNSQTFAPIAQFGAGLSGSPIGPQPFVAPSFAPLKGEKQKLKPWMFGNKTDA